MCLGWIPYLRILAWSECVSTYSHCRTSRVIIGSFDRQRATLSASSGASVGSLGWRSSSSWGLDTCPQQIRSEPRHHLPLPIVHTCAAGCLPRGVRGEVGVNCCFLDLQFPAFSADKFDGKGFGCGAHGVVRRQGMGVELRVGR